MKRPLACVAIAAALLAPAAARGQNANDAAAAEALFEEGRKLLAEGKVGAACAKLAESNRLDTGIGTLLYLGDCYEKNGQTASAWATFREALAIAQSKGDNREGLARTRAAALEPKLHRVVVSVAAANRVDGLVVKRDGAEVGGAAWGSEVPVDPGRHVVTATAPGRETWQTTLDIRDEAGRTVVEVPPLKPAKVAATPQTVKPEEPQRDGSGQRVLGLTIAGFGLVGVGVGTVLGLNAKSKADEADKYCSGAACDAPGLPLRDDAKSLATGSTIAFIVGGVAVAAGAVVFFTAPRSGTKSAAMCDGTGCRVTTMFSF